MQLRNREDHQLYIVTTESDVRGGFLIYAVGMEDPDKSHVMHYGSLAEFCSDWEDV